METIVQYLNVRLDLTVNERKLFLYTHAHSPGPQGVQGQAGPPGAQGEKGDKGDKGDQGEQGLPGPIGPIGQCANDNPFCLQGATGPAGPQGPIGLTGAQGLRGPTGIQGPAGVSGLQGPKGDTGDTGPQGPQGVQGIPGVCNCFSLPMVTIDNLDVTTSLTLTGSMTCPGGALDISCFGLAACPDFSLCDMHARSLILDSGVPNTSFKVGKQGDTGTTVEMGDSAIAGPEYKMDSFKMYSTFANYDTSGPQNFRTVNGNIVIQANGGILRSATLQSTGTVSVIGGGGVSVLATSQNIVLNAVANVAQIQLQASLGTISLSAITLTLTAPNMVIQQSAGNPWLTFDSANSLVCSGAVPLSTTAGTSMKFDRDIILGQNARLMTSATNGVFRLGGILELCGYILRTSGATLQLQDDSTTDVLDVRAQISNGELNMPVTINDPEGLDLYDTILTNSGPSLYVTFNDTDGIDVRDSPLLSTLGPVVFKNPSNGVDFYNTPLHNSFSTDPLEVDDMQGLRVSPGKIFTAEIQSIGPTLTLTGNVVISGTLNGQTISGTGPCCTSDARVKENVTHVTSKSDLDVIMSLPKRVAYTYTKAYQAVDKWVSNELHHSWIAQELETVLPNVVHKVERVIDGIHMPDFRVLSMDRMVPHLAGAIQELKRENEQLRALIEKLIVDIKK